MTDPLFFVCITVAVLAYGIQGSLQTIYARKYDAILVALYRNLSLVITMAPVLFFVPYKDIFAVQDHLGTLILASGTGAISLLLAFSAVRYLPISIGTAIRQVMQVTVAVVVGALFLQEYLTAAQLILLVVIVTAGISLSLIKSNHTHLDPRYVWKGIGLTALGGFVVSLSFYFFSVLSREIHPFAASYFWEAGVGIFMLLFFLIQAITHPQKRHHYIPLNDGIKVATVSLLTILATISYSLAVNHGPYALAGGILTTTTLVVSVMGWIIYKEHLSRLQITVIFIAVVCMILLKVAS